METTEHLKKARQRSQEVLKQRSESQRFQLAWRSSEPEYLTGWEATARHLNVKVATLRVRISATKNSYCLERINPLTNELDILTVSLVKLDKPVVKRGRPPKFIDWERLGTQAPGYDKTTDTGKSASNRKPSSAHTKPAKRQRSSKRTTENRLKEI